MKNYRLKGASGSLDTHRAAQEILRDALEGQIVLFYEPPDAATAPTIAGSTAHAAAAAAAAANATKPLEPRPQTARKQRAGPKRA